MESQTGKKSTKPHIDYSSVVRLLDEKEKRALFDLLFQSIGHDRKRMAEIMGVTKSATYYYDSSSAAPSFEHAAIILAELLRLTCVKGDKHELDAQSKKQLGLMLYALRKRFSEANNSMSEIEFFDLLTTESLEPEFAEIAAEKKLTSEEMLEVISQIIGGAATDASTEDALKTLQANASREEHALQKRVMAIIRRVSEIYPKHAIEYAGRTYDITGEKDLRAALKLIVAAGWAVLETHNLLDEVRKEAESKVPALFDYRLNIVPMGARKPRFPKIEDNH